MRSQEQLWVPLSRQPHGLLIQSLLCPSGLPSLRAEAVPRGFRMVLAHGQFLVPMSSPLHPTFGLPGTFAGHAGDGSQSQFLQELDVNKEGSKGVSWYAESIGVCFAAKLVSLTPQGPTSPFPKDDWGRARTTKGKPLLGTCAIGTNVANTEACQLSLGKDWMG